MTEEANDHQYDSGDDFEKPKDEFMFYYKAFKPEEKKMYQHQRFEEIAVKYWQLLRLEKNCDLNKATISQVQYTDLMKRIYKVLLPLYREEEMVSEISQEWLMDSRGQPALTFNLFTKLLFRVAHQWATNIDLDEYIDLLSKIYNRITVMMVLHENGETRTIHATIYLTFPSEEKKDDSSNTGNNGIENDDWLECRSDESSRSEYDYKYREDPNTAVPKKYKKRREQYSGAGGAGSANTVIKDPFVYEENAVFEYNLTEGMLSTMMLADLIQVQPFGYPTEQFFKQQKNDVFTVIEEAKAENKKNLARIKREQKEQDGDQDISKYHTEVDSGLVEEDRSDVFQLFPLRAPGQWHEIFVSISVRPAMFNKIRKLIREGQQLKLRMYSPFPRPGARTKSRSTLHSNEPVTEFNNFGYNPALERRVFYKLLPILSDPTEQEFQNVYYLLRLPENEAYYRSDVYKVETKDHLSLKENEDIKKEEDFVNVETSYKKMRQIMLNKKFESIFSDRCSADNKEQRRLKKIIDKEDKRRAGIQKAGNLANKGLSETYEEKSVIKMMKGPFYQLDSKEGLKEDNFVSCTEYDLIDAANTLVYRIIVLGKPRSGKSTLAKNLSIKLDLVHVNVENWIKALFEKIKNYEPPEDLEEGVEPPKFLTDLEQEVSDNLKNGTGPTDQHTVQILKEQINSPQAKTKGYILDLTFYQRQQSWASTIRQDELLGKLADGTNIHFSHVIELSCDDEEIKLRAKHMRTNPEDGVTYSRWEREERKKPKIVNEDDEINEEDEIKPLDELALVQSINDMDERINDELRYYNTVERSSMEELLLSLYDSQYIKVDSAGLTPDEITECVACKIKPDDDLPLRPIGIVIEGGSDFKGLLTEGQEENQIPRTWSMWKQIDPVALLDGKVIQGLPEYAISYHNNVFVFSTEENMKAFQQEPKIYLLNAPQMPDIFRILMLGPQGVGKHTQAQLLSDTYGWKIVDFKQIVRSKLEDLMKYEIHIPNNPMQGGRIGLSENELSDVVEGKSFPSWKYIPWIFDYLGFELEKKRPPPPEANPEEEEQAVDEDDEDVKKKKELELKKKKDEEEKKRKEEEEIQKAKEDRKRRRQEAIEQGLDLVELGLENEEEEVIIIEDLSVDDLVLKIDETTGKTPFVGGFILVGFPETEEHINKLKEHGIEFEKIIYLNDTNEEEPGTEIKKRMVDDEMYDWDWENENAQRILNLAKEHLNEENVKEISCNGTTQDVLIRLRNEIDPFYIKVDNPDDVRVSADLGEEDRKLPKGDFGDYCPVTYVKDNWMVRGNPEQEVTINGKTHIFAGEKEAEEFKFNPSKFLIQKEFNQTLPLQPPPPKIMILGVKGSGVTTQIRQLCDKFKLDEFNLMEEYLNKLKEEKEQRKRRRLLDRGFRPPQPSDEEGQDYLPDPEIEDDPEDFDKEGHERDVMKMIFDSNKGLVIDGTWTTLPEDTVGQSLQDLLVESRRVPEIVIMLKCKEQNTFQRLIDTDSIKATYDRLMEQRTEDRKKLRDEDREAKLQELRADEEKTPEDIQEEMNKWEEDRDGEDEAFDENDPEKPNFDEMLEKEKEALKERREKDEAFMEEFGTALKEKGVVVIDDIKADVSAEYVFIKLLDKIKDNFALRKDLIKKQQAQSLKPEEVPFYEKSYIYKHSKFGINSPLLLSNPVKTKKHTVLYRERLYFLSDPEQQQLFLKEPSKYTRDVKTVPLDINIQPKIVVIGLPKSGKSTLCRKIVEKTGIVYLKMTKIIQGFMDKDSVWGDSLRNTLKREGKHLEDEMLVNLLLKRLQYKDCQTKGWILEDFPKTRNQAIQLAKKGVVPSNVIYIRVGDQELFNRVLPNRTTKFGSNRFILNQRLKYFESNMPNLLSFYQRYYNNLCEIDTAKSKWFMEDRAMREIRDNLASRQNFARDYYYRESGVIGCKVQDLHMDRCLVKQSLSEFKYYCPVTWRNEKLLVKCTENIENCVLLNNYFYYFKTSKERDMFLSNPTRFLLNSNFPKPQDLSQRFYPHKAAEIIVHEKALNGHCSVTLIDEERVSKGDPILLIQYKDSKFIFDTEFKLQRFLANPFKYSKATLPVKMPPTDDKVSLYNLSKMEDSIIFMEQSLGQIVTRALREVSDNRVKYPTLSVKETMLKLFSLFLKTENPANTEFMKKKYSDKMKAFIARCEMPEEIFDLAQEKDKKQSKASWPEFKESYYNELGANYDQVIKTIDQEKVESFTNYIR